MFAPLSGSWDEMYLFLTGINVVFEQQLIKKNKKNKKKKLALKGGQLWEFLEGEKKNISGMSQSCQYPWAKHTNKFNRVRVFSICFTYLFLAIKYLNNKLILLK